MSRKTEIRNTIILIGPEGVGKSTLAQLLSEKLGLPQYPVDTHRCEYYNEIGYDENKANSLYKDEGMYPLFVYWRRFEAHAVARHLASYKNCIIDFGAGHSVYDDEALFNNVKNVLEPYKFVLLILPSADLSESVEILRERAGENTHNGIDFHDFFVRHPSNHALAKYTIYTKDKTPEETCNDIIKIINQNDTI